MSMSYTFIETETFTVTHARYLASKVAADLKRLQRLYTEPDDQRIARYEAEVTALLKAGFLDEVTYGFRRNGNWVVALKYRVDSSGNLTSDDNPGRVGPHVDVSGVAFGSYLVKNAAWNSLSFVEQALFEATLPIQRGDGPEPGVENGYWWSDRSYAAGGRALARSSIRMF